MTEEGINKNVKSKLKAKVVFRRNLIQNTKGPLIKAEGYLLNMDD